MSIMNRLSLPLGRQVSTMKILLYLLYGALSLSTCGQQDKIQKNETASLDITTGNDPPTCDCCVFEDTSLQLNYQAKLAADTATGERIILRGLVYESDGKT